MREMPSAVQDYDFDRYITNESNTSKEIQDERCEFCYELDCSTCEVVEEYEPESEGDFKDRWNEEEMFI